jgi:hypothetical protein
MVEAKMPEQSSAHFYLNWTKERIDEMDAALASLEATQARRSSEILSRLLLVALSTQAVDFEMGAAMTALRQLTAPPRNPTIGAKRNIGGEKSIMAKATTKAQ